jgi:hypothetical protein
VVLILNYFHSIKKEIVLYNLFLFLLKYKTYASYLSDAGFGNNTLRENLNLPVLGSVPINFTSSL